MERKRIGFIGNFIPKYSTENDRKWSLRMMGHDVITFQENETSPFTLIRYAEEKSLDLLLYSHTHDPSYVIPDLKTVFRLYKEKGIPTASIHLDRWVGLAREKDMGKEATWFTEWQFMADGSPEAAKKYKEMGLNWSFSPPGVVARDCYLANPDPITFPHDIVFVGSKGYHSEYPERPQLIEWLAKTYGRRFGHYGNDGLGVVRGHDLNVLYATASIVIGDSCFGGRPYYWSDRIPETVGRGGWLIHPDVEGCSVPFSFYKSFPDLERKIAFWTAPENREHKMHMRWEAFQWVRQHETYTNRMQEILNTIYGIGKKNPTYKL